METTSARHREDDASYEKEKGAESRFEDSGSDVPRVEIPDHEQFEWYEVRRAFREPQVWITGIAYMSICVVLYSISLFLPTIVVRLLVQPRHGLSADRASPLEQSRLPRRFGAGERDLIHLLRSSHERSQLHSAYPYLPAAGLTGPSIELQARRAS